MKFRTSRAGWTDRLPTHWAEARMRFVAAINPSKSELAKVNPDTEVSFLPMEAVGEDGAVDQTRTKPIAEVSNGYTYFRDDDLLVAKITPCFENGKAAQVKNLTSGIGFGSTEFHVLRARKGLDDRFLLHLVRSPIFRDFGAASMYGAGGQKRVPTDFVADFVVPLPPLLEQRAIAAFLDREIDKIDSLIRKQAEFLSRIDQHYHALIAKAVTKGLDHSAEMRSTGLPGSLVMSAHWKLIAVRHLVSCSTSGPRGWSEFIGDSGTLFFQSQNIGRTMETLFATAARVIPPDGPDVERAAISLDDVLVCITGARTSAVAHVERLPEPAFVNQHVCLLRPRQGKVIGRFLAYALWSKVGQNQLAIASYGLKQGLALDDIRQVMIPLPDTAEQKRIVDYLDHRLSIAQRVRLSANRIVEQLIERRGALIMAAVAGKLEIAQPPQSAAAA